MNSLASRVTQPGDSPAAGRSAEESRVLHRAANDAWGVATALGVLGRTAQAGDDLETAARHYAEGLRMLVGAGVERAIPEFLENLAGVLVAWGQVDRAALLAGAGEALQGMIGIAPAAAGGTAPAVDLGGLRAGPHAAAWTEGQSLTRDQVIAEAIALTRDIECRGRGSRLAG